VTKYRFLFARKLHKRQQARLLLIAGYDGETIIWDEKRKNLIGAEMRPDNWRDFLGRDLTESEIASCQGMKAMLRP